MFVCMYLSIYIYIHKAVTCCAGATFDVTEMTPSPPSRVNSNAFESSPESSMKSSPQSARKVATRHLARAQR